MENYSYVGSELELFRLARNWKNYYHRIIYSYLGENVLEVGAGIGSTTKILCSQNQQKWVCLEPDELMIDMLKSEKNLPQICEIKHGSLANISFDYCFDSIIYIDVLEHIEDDFAEIKRATANLRSGGFLVVLAPAHQWLFSPFDKSVGHFRRYNRQTIKRLTPPELRLVNLKYIDSVGLIASASNHFLKQSIPTLQQVKLWDTWMIPVSKVFDPILKYKFGKSILAVWKKF
ncbi:MULTISPECIES: bifunctional 2-polyprenyl-6-hydroxyphenol methylase/3-demethylubiquinol 3-O-methyltransferase UbiG [unclassified Synechocystis]|uniref:class I SAM-dependent methyltransferase n=1 Tax=unclassified Synechocystis TaxID=2640012 RepID=UPI00041B85AF|nr:MULTISPECIES: class I SAM-dependent methyltransferase [unclassified Synechocystis]AIE73103.1 glycosyl transferase family 2 [Synechocystis sp. PCC 6714]MCT0254374.1 class I SAM-dependent methyltransferase [Synechocystis sp. CS-94]